jgi:demethylmenaquinone methyltransferase/2-methoxy-6-polyprenyl-1,4-benzoquinol methylase
MTEENETEIRLLEQANPLREPALWAAIKALQLEPGTRGLDIGCGIGLQSLLLAEATNPDGLITGLDISPELLAYARQRVQTSPFAGQISFREGDMGRLPFEDNSFDWAWSADCAGYPAGDHLSLLKEIARVVRPGGRVALLGWTSQQVLPGHPLLEARLNAECSAYAPYLQGRDPEAHFLRAVRWFPQAGIKDPTCRTFVGEAQAPLDPSIRLALTSLFEMLWSKPQGQATDQDWREYQRLCMPGSADFILDIPNYYAFFTYTMIFGRVEKSA